MAVDRVAKVLVAVHRDAGDPLLQSLQRAAILHITGIEDAESPGESGELDQRLGRLGEAIEFLSSRHKQQGGFLGGDRIAMSRAEFELAVSEFDPTADLDRLAVLGRELGEIDGRIRTLDTDAAKLGPWRGLRHSPADLRDSARVVVTLGRLADASELARAAELLKNMPATVEPAGTADGGVPVIVAAARDVAEEVARLLATLRFEAVELGGVDRPPADALVSIDREKAELAQRRDELQAEIDRLGAELARLKALADDAGNARSRAAAMSACPTTATTLLITGWVRERDRPRLARLVEGTGVAALSVLEPDEGEQPPVVLTNPRVLRPFELVLDMFSMPVPSEMDPTWLIAPFFAVFFGLCLTDAGYALVVVGAVVVLMSKMGWRNKLLGIVLIGAIVTVPAGAMVGGWFGDFPDRLGIPWLFAFKNALLWFDPVKEPMKFFLLSLGIGYLHLIVGIVFEIADCIRVRNFGEAFLGQLPWFVLLNGLVALAALGKSIPAWLGPVLLVLVLAAVAEILVFTRRSRETALSQTLWFGLVLGLLVFFAARLGRLPAGYLAVKWFVLAVFLGMYVRAVASLIRGTRLRPVQTVLGIAGVVGLLLYSARVLPAALAGVLGVAFFFSTPADRRLLKKFLWGGYALYGATGYIGVVLSYIRLMALGMCTGGIAVAVNVIAWMVLPIPVVGVVMAILILLIGHTYNIAVNVLGAFVHSLRLHYVEFFPRFYTGGGEPFVPFREENRFVTVKST